MVSAAEMSMSKLTSFIEESERWIHMHQRTMETLCQGGQQSRQVEMWIKEITKSLGINKGNCANIIKDFLVQAGQSALYDQFKGNCKNHLKIENNLKHVLFYLELELTFSSTLDNVRHSTLNMIRLVGHFASIASLFPSSYKSKHRNFAYAAWAKEVTEDFSVYKCQEVMARFNQIFGETSEGKSLEFEERKRHHVLNCNFQMDNWAQEINLRLQSIFHKMMQEKIENR